VPAQQDSYGSPPLSQHTTEHNTEPVYLPTTTTSNVFLNHNPAASSYEQQLRFLSPAQPASPVFTTATERLPPAYQQVPVLDHSATFHPEPPSAQEYVQVSMLKNFFVQTVRIFVIS